MNDEQTAVFLRELLQETEIIVGSIRASAYQAILTITLADPQEWRETGSSLVTATLKDIESLFISSQPPRFPFVWSRSSDFLESGPLDLTQREEIRLRQVVSLPL